MTIYVCSICGKTHDTAADPPCPQVIGAVAEQRPETPDGAQPPWKRRYFCPQCPPPGIGQPKDGFSVPGLTEHVSAHAVAHLREVLEDAETYHFALHRIESMLELGWSLETLRQEFIFYIGQGLHRHDEAWWARWHLWRDAALAAGK